MTTIDDLPPNVLNKILSKLRSDPDAFVHACLASRQWEHLIWARQCCSLITDAEDNFEVWRSKSRPPCVWIVDRNGHKQIVYGPVTNNFTLLGTTTLKDYNVLAQTLTKLVVLQIGWLNLEMCGISQAWSSFPLLTKLTLGGPASIDRLNVFDYSARTEILNNLGGLMSLLSSVKFPKLETLVTSALFHESRSNILVNSLLTFLEVHQDTLLGLSVVLHRAEHVQIPNQGDDNGKSLFRDWEIVPAFEKRLAGLSWVPRDLFYHYTDPTHNYVNMLKLIQHISGRNNIALKPGTTQAEITASVVLGSDYATSPLTLIQNNSRTLTILGLQIRLTGQLDCKVFQNCANLKKLLLSAPPKTLNEFEMTNYLDLPAKPDLINIASLPQTLKFIQIVNFFIGTDDSKLFMNIFPLLKHLNLQGIGEKEELGLTLDTFFKLLLRGISDISVYRGFNMASVEADQGSDDPMILFRTIFLLGICKRDSGNKSHIWQLSGYNWNKQSLNPILLPDCDRTTLRESLSPKNLFVYGFQEEGRNNCTFKIYQGQQD